jgi:hypothetical protein
MFTAPRQPFPASFLLSAILAFGMICSQKSGGAEPAGVRTWTEAESRRTIEAEFVELRNGNVCVKRTDGKIFELDPRRLIAADREYVQALTGSHTDAAAMSLGDGGPHEATKITADADTQVVIAEGVGTNPEEALREAVRQVVGTFVDAETLVKNDELVSDKILTYSNGYITAYKTLRETERNGLARVTIQAAVKCEPLAAKLSEVNVTVAPFPGSKLFAQAISQTAAEKDARALLRSALVGFPHNLIEATSEEEPRIEERSEENATISYQVKVGVNIDKYTQFQQRLTQVLERIAKEKGETALMKRMSPEPTAWSDPFGVLGPPAPRGDKGTPPSFEVLGWFSGPLWPGYRESWEAPLDEQSDIVFVVNTGRTRMHDKTTWKWYCVPRAAIAPPGEFARLGSFAFAIGRHDVCAAPAKIQVEFLEGNGTPVIADDILMTPPAPGSSVHLSMPDMGRGGMGGMGGVGGSQANPGGFSWVISPYIIATSAYARSVTIPRRLELPLETLAEIESVRCTVTEP